MGSDLSWAAIYSLKSAQDWISTLNSNMAGSTRTAYKNSKVIFGGAGSSVARSPSGAVQGLQYPETRLISKDTNIDFGQGAIVASSEDTHFAVQGNGFFMVTDKAGKYYYTRDGEFHLNESGQLVNTQGLYYVDTAMAINLGIYTAPAPTVAEIDANDTGWHNYETANGNNWFPYVAGTVYDEPAWAPGNGYQTQTINAKKTFFLSGGSLTGAEQVTLWADDTAYMTVNGVLIGAGDLVAGTHPPTWATSATYNIGPYLKDGMNTIILQASEGGIGDSVSLAGVAAGVTLNTDTTWATEVIPYTGSGVPTATSIENATTAHEKDMFLALPVTLTSLQYSQYGSTVFEGPNPTIMGEAGQNGLGNVQSRALESSNSSMNQIVPQLSLAQKMYTAISKVYQVLSQNIDLAINLIK